MTPTEELYKHVQECPDCSRGYHEECRWYACLLQESLTLPRQESPHVQRRQSHGVSSMYLWGIIAVLLLLVFLCHRIHSEPVNTTAFGFIKAPMSETVVLQRLGQPDAIIDVETLLVPVWHAGHKAYRQKVSHTYVYRGDFQILTSYIRFEDGKVIRTWKGR